MKTKRILSILLAVAMVVTLLPVTALADAPDKLTIRVITKDVNGTIIDEDSGTGAAVNGTGGSVHRSNEYYDWLVRVFDVTASPESGYKFTGWSGDIREGSNDNPNSVRSRDGDKAITAYFQKERTVYTLSTEVPGGHGSISKNPDKTSFYEGDSVILTANPESEWEFAGWSGDASGTTNPLTVTMNSSKNIKASFTAIPKYALNVAIDGNGTVTKNPNNSTYLRGTDVTLTANPAEGWQFSGWSGDASGTGASATVNMNSEKNVTATFTALPTYELTTGVNVPGSGSVSKSPDWVSYYQGKSVSLTASAATGWRFGSWSGDATGSSNPVSVTMDASKSVTANFIQQFYITLNDPAGGHYDNEGAIEKWHDVDSTINLGDANPDSDFMTSNKFIGWKDSITGEMVSDYKSENYTFKLTGNRSFTAMYGDAEWLDTSSENNSKGYLANDLDGHYGRGAVVNLNDAQPTAKTGYTFSHWQELKWRDWVDVPLVGGEPIITIGDSNWFRAMFVRDVSTVSFEENGGTPNVPDQTVEYDKKATRPTTVMTKTGYTFVNWYADAACTTLFNFNTKIKADTVIYANWTANSYTVAYDANSGTGTMTPSAYTYDAEQALKKNTFTKTGCEFAGWATSSTGSVVYSDEQVVKNLATGGTVTLYAKWNVSGVSVSGYEREYDGTYRGLSVSGAEGATVWYSEGDELHYVSAPPTFKDVTPAGGITVYVKVERTNAATYTTSAVIKITKKALTVTADNKSVKYGDAAPLYTATITGFVSGEDDSVVTGAAALSCPYAPGNNVGDYTITAGAGTLAATNYTFAPVDGKLTVGAATLTVTADDKSATYGDAAPAYTATITGFVNGEDDSIVTGDAALSCPYAPGNNVGDYTITAGVGTLAAPNYTFTAVDGKLTVDPKALKVTADNKTVIYGGSSPMYTVSYDGFITGEDETKLSGTLALNSTYAAGSNVGTYPITPSGLTSTNYDISFADGTLTVNKAALTVTAEDKAVTFLDAAPAYTAKYSGFVAGDTAAKLNGMLAYTCSYASGSAVGTYPITPSGLTSDNYNITFKDGTLTVNTLMLTVTFQDYNGTPLGTSTVAYGKPAAPPANPVREGYTFTGWSTSFDKVTSALTVTAQYAINTYTVRFFAVDGVTEIGTPQTINWDSPAVFPTAPARTGYAFDEWVLTGDNAGYADSLTHVKENINAVASYIRNGYTVTFVDYDGSVIGTDGVLYGRGAEAPVPPTRAGYTFTGWDREFDPVTGNITVTAQYEINRYTVRFLDYDGTEIDSQTVDYNTAATAPADPKRDGYTFTGWDTSFEAVTSDITVTAQYEQVAPVPSEPVPETNNNIPDEPVPSTGGSAFAWWWIAVIVLGAGLLFFLIFFVWKRRRKEEEQQ